MDGASIQFAELESDGLWTQADISFGVVCPSLSLAVSVALVFWGGNSGDRSPGQKELPRLGEARGAAKSAEARDVCGSSVGAIETGVMMVVVFCFR